MYLLTANVVRKAPKNKSCYLQIRLFFPTLEQAEKEKNTFSHNKNFFNLSIHKI